MEEENFNQKEWNNLIASQNLAQFLQSWQWGKFQESLNRDCLKLKNNWGQTLIIKYNLPFKKNYLYCPRGPILTSSQTNANSLQINVEKFLKEIFKLAKREKSIFVRIEPSISLNFWSKKGEKNKTKWCIKINEADLKLSIIKIPDVQPSKTLILDLSKSEEEILAKMHYKTRYNIRLAQHRGIIIREGQPEEIEKFLELLRQTTKRNKFHPHPDNYYRKLINLQTYKPINFLSKLYLAEYKNKILAANIIIFFGDTATYLHGASSNEYRNLMAPHLLQWAVIKEAKKLGYRYYDFWGIDEKKWPGLTRFKKGFGGQIIEYPGTFDIIINKLWYQLYRLGKLLKKF